MTLVKVSVFVVESEPSDNTVLILHKITIILNEYKV